MSIKDVVAKYKREASPERELSEAVSLLKKYENLSYQYWETRNQVKKLAGGSFAKAIEKLAEQIGVVLIDVDVAIDDTNRLPERSWIIVNVDPEFASTPDGQAAISILQDKLLELGFESETDDYHGEYINVWEIDEDLYR